MNPPAGLPQRTASYGIAEQHLGISQASRLPFSGSCWGTHVSVWSRPAALSHVCHTLQLQHHKGLPTARRVTPITSHLHLTPSSSHSENVP